MFQTGRRSTCTCTFVVPGLLPGAKIALATTPGKSLGEIAEPTGWEGNFYRVNLSVIKNGQIPYQTFFDAFIRSVNGIRPVTVAEWQKEWNRIEAIIRSMNLSLPDYENDRKEIDDRLERGEYVGHHSKAFEDSYSPHYRIISKEIFEQELQPLIQLSSN